MAIYLCNGCDRLKDSREDGFNSKYGNNYCDSCAFEQEYKAHCRQDKKMDKHGLTALGDGT